MTDKPIGMQRVDECLAFIRVYADEITQIMQDGGINAPDYEGMILRRLDVIREYVTEAEHERHMARHVEMGD